MLAEWGTVQLSFINKELEAMPFNLKKNQEFYLLKKKNNCFFFLFFQYKHVFSCSLIKIIPVQISLLNKRKLICFFFAVDTHKTLSYQLLLVLNHKFYQNSLNNLFLFLFILFLNITAKHLNKILFRNTLPTLHFEQKFYSKNSYSMYPILIKQKGSTIPKVTLNTILSMNSNNTH